MRCIICNSDSDAVILSCGEFSPCAECQAAIYDCLKGYEDVEPIDGEVETVKEEFDV